MANGKKATDILIGRIYERTEALPVIQKDIGEMKLKLNSDHFRLTAVEKKINQSVGVKFAKILSLILGGRP